MSELVDVEEWERWLTSRSGRRCWASWAGPRPALAGWPIDELADPRWSPAVDRLQHELVGLTQLGHGRAATTLLVQLRPGLGRLVRRQTLAGDTGGEAIDEVRSAFYETLCRHPLERRPRRIAANLVLDTRQRLDRSRGGRRGQGPIPTDAADLASDRPGWRADPLRRVLIGLTVSEALDALPGSDRSRAITATAAYRAWFLDQPHERIAADLGLERAAVRKRLERLRTAARRQWEHGGSEDERWAA